MDLALRLLIVEDSRDDAELLLRELRRGGYRPDSTIVQTAEALDQALNRGPWDLIIADYSMPGFSGTVALRQVRERGLDVPFIFVSGTIGEDIAVAAMQAGAQDYLRKGDLKRLVPAIGRELREAESRRERTRAVEALRNSEARFRAVVEASPLAIVGLTAAGDVSLWNQAAERLFGWTRDEVVGRPNPITPQQEPGSPNTQVTGLHVRGQRRDGKQLDLKVSFAALRDQANQPAGLMAVFEDETEALKLEAQLRQSQKMEAVGRLAGGVAHDFNNLLTVIMGEADLLLPKLGEGDPAREGLGEIRKAAESAASLTRQLLAFSRKQLVEPRVLSLDQLVGELEPMLRRLIGESIELLVRRDPEAGMVKADPGRIEQVLLNLVVNARDAMPTGGTLVIETANATLDEEYARMEVDVRPGEYVGLTVSDTGAGMAPEVQAHAFEPFFTTKGEGKGTGLGLATCYGIIKQFGGHIALYSEPGLGTTIKAYLPRVDEPPTRESAATEAPRGTETVLLVEDDNRVRAVTARMLRGQGYTVLEASDGYSALDQLGEAGKLVDLLLSDVVLPRMGGRELAERARRIRPGLPVLFASGYTDDVILQHQLLEHGVALVQKPFTPQQLARRVRDVLDRADAP